MKKLILLIAICLIPTLLWAGSVQDVISVIARKNVAGGPTTEFEDSFTDTNGVLLHNHSPDTGSAWTLVTDGAYDLRINTNQTMSTLNGGGAGETVYTSDEMGTADNWVQLTDTGAFTAGAALTYLAVRLVDTDNWVGWYLGGNGASGSRLAKNVAGSITDLVSVQGADNDVIKITAEGNSICFYIDTVLQGSCQTVTDHNTEQSVGFVVNESAGVPLFDDYSAGKM